MSLLAAVLAGFVCLFMFDAFAFPMTMGTLFLLLGMIGCLHRVESERHFKGGRDGQVTGLPTPNCLQLSRPQAVERWRSRDLAACSAAFDAP